MENNRILLKDKDRKTLTLKGDTEIVAEKDSDTSLIVNILSSMQVSLHITLQENARAVIFYQNSAEDFEVEEVVDVAAYGEVRIAYCELESKQLNRTVKVNLNGPEASVNLISGAFVDDKKHMDILCDHCVPHTYSEMQTYGVILTNGDYKVLANGKIERGAYGSKTHQTSRVLTFSEKQNALVEPMLMIDENDVEASHATSIGQLDENQLYYLMSRGITKSEALKLISLGYLMPLTQVTEDEELKKSLEEYIEKKVAEACLA
mgnify:CR=1 FL=1